MPAALGIATGNTLEGLCAAWLVRRLTDRYARFRHPEAVFAFAAAAGLGSAIAATAGVSSLYFAGAVTGEQFLGNWYTWWQGDTTGILLVAPCILAWIGKSGGSATRAGTNELALFAALLMATLLALFAHAHDAYDARPLAFLVLPFFVWAACRFSERAVTLTVLAANGWAIWCTVHGLGPFQRASLNEALLMLQAFTSTCALVALVLWAVMRQRAEALQFVQDSSGALVQRMWSHAHGLRGQIAQYQEAQALAHVGSWSWDAASNRVAWSAELCRMFGIRPEQFGGSFEAYFSRVHPSDRERVRDTIKDARARHRSWESTERVLRADGETRVLRSIGCTQPRKGGPVARMHGVFIDVTEAANPDDVRETSQLPQMLHAYAEQFEQQSGVSVEVVAGSPAAGLDPRTTRVLFWIAQEALHNVAEHSRAHRVLVELEWEAGLATLTVRDDGIGFTPERGELAGTGMMLMRERAEATGGRLWIESSPGNGATLRVTARG
jgi:PAS domain S-box-containing protein